MYCRQALSRGSLDRGIGDASLYSKAFMGQVNVVARCTQCLSEFHSIETCPDLPRAWSYPMLPLQPMQVPAVFHSVAGNGEICKRRGVMLAQAVSL